MDDFSEQKDHFLPSYHAYYICSAISIAGSLYIITIYMVQYMILLFLKISHYFPICSFQFPLSKKGTKKIKKGGKKEHFTPLKGTFLC